MACSTIGDRVMGNDGVPAMKAWSRSLVLLSTVVGWTCGGEPSDSQPVQNWYVGDNHMHSRFSDGTRSPKQTAEACQALGYDFATLTDHNVILGNEEFRGQTTPQFVGMGGEENTRFDGHYLAYGIQSVITTNGSAQEIIDAVNRNKPGISFGYIAHPMWSSSMSQGGDWEWHDWSVSGYSGIEVWNTYYPHNFHENYNEAAFAKWDELNNAGKHLYGMANSDAHNTDSSLGHGWNVVSADLLTEANLLSAMKKGHFFGSNGPNIDFTSNGSAMGSDVSVSSGVLRRILLRASDSVNIASVKLIKNGEVIESWAPHSPDWSMTLENVSAKPGDFFRMTVEGVDRFAFSNPIFVTE